jgi:hypothetical protein
MHMDGSAVRLADHGRIKQLPRKWLAYWKSDPWNDLIQENWARATMWGVRDTRVRSTRRANVTPIIVLSARGETEPGRELAALVTRRAD